MSKLFCDLKSDEEKYNFFLFGHGYETGVISITIQNDVALAYKRCCEFSKALVAERKRMEEAEAELEACKSYTVDRDMELSTVQADNARLRWLVEVQTLYLEWMHRKVRLVHFGGWRSELSNTYRKALSDAGYGG